MNRLRKTSRAWTLLVCFNLGADWCCGLRIVLSKPPPARQQMNQQKLGFKRNTSTSARTPHLPSCVSSISFLSRPDFFLGALEANATWSGSWINHQGLRLRSRSTMLALPIVTKSHITIAQPIVQVNAGDATSGYTTALAVEIPLMALALATVALRVYSRLAIKRKLAADDILIILGTVREAKCAQTGIAI